MECTNWKVICNSC